MGEAEYDSKTEKAVNFRIRYRRFACSLVIAIGLWTNSPCLHSQESESQVQKSVAGNAQVEALMKSFKPRGAQNDGSSPTPPKAALQRFNVRPEVEIELVASEPELSQPLFLSWDSRGRMWVVQYRQYQFPAGLKIVRYDQHLRAVFDKVPEPPPHGTPGADRITVFEDSNGDGKYDQSKDVITGLSIASSIQVGTGGIWVLNPPYLLFYPDADGDDVPDGNPEVHLSGFGLQDTHSVANSLLWGPDGWLYGANGSTTTGTVSSKESKGVSFEGQCIWRYHPTTHVFEIFAEGGGNTFSLEIDSKGRVFSGTNSGSTRGYYYPQGSYADKNWGKHGPLTNPFAFGFFRSMKMKGDPRRFAQAFAIYEGGLFSQDFSGTIVAPNSLHNLVWNSRLIPDGSTYRTVDESNLLESDDRWFRPVYTGVGPDGTIYLADWYDTRLSHVSPVDDWHKKSGRVYRIKPTGSNPVYREGDLKALSSVELIDKFNHPNKWVRQRAVLELGWRKDRSVVGQLEDRITDEASLESLWAINLLDELTTKRAAAWLNHPDSHIRRWVVRLLGDRHEGLAELVELATRERDVQVRSQLAASAKRVDAKTGLAVLSQLVQHDKDREDPHLPLMYWWALESHADQWNHVEAFFDNPERWKLPLVRNVLIGRLMQRYASRGKPEDLVRCLQLYELAPDRSAKQILIKGLYQAFQGRAVPELPERLEAALTQYQSSLGEAGVVLALRSGRPEAVEAAIKSLSSATTEVAVRIELAKTFGELKYPDVTDTLLKLATARDHRQPALQRVAIESLVNYEDPRIPNQLASRLYDAISAEHSLRSTACRTLASRKSWAVVLLNEINQWRLKVRDVPQDVVQRLRAYDDPELTSAVNQAFGKPVEISTPEKLVKIKRLEALLRNKLGDPQAGKVHFTKHCANCHKLFGEGQSIGPPLDGYDRGNLKFWLTGIVEPSLEIREGYQSYKAMTTDGRLITGMIEAQDPNTVTFRTADTKQVIVPRDEIEAFQAIKTSLMPEKLLDEFNDQQIQDLMAYLSLGVR